MHDVIIIGGGPVGMLVANEVAMHGIDTLVLETRTEISEYPKAGTYHARAISTLLRRGIITLPRQTTDYKHISYEIFQFAGFPWLTLHSRTIDGPVMLGMAQSDLERNIADHAAIKGAKILRGVTVIAVEQNKDHACVTVLDSLGQESKCYSRFVVGADGGRSIVLRSGNFISHSYPPTMRAMLGLTVLPHPEQMRVGWNRTERGWTLLNLNRYGESRIIVFEFDGPERDRHAVVTPEEFSLAVDRVVGSHVELNSPHYLNRFSDYSRIIDNYRDERLFLAGDAAHIHYPLGGQGLNTGISDAVNLGWKLAAVIKGAADIKLLDTYSSERQPIGHWVIDNTRLQSILMNPAVKYDSIRSMIVQMLAIPKTHDWLAEKINGTSIKYKFPNQEQNELDGTFFPDLVLQDSIVGEISVSDLLIYGRIVILVKTDVGAIYKEDMLSIPFSTMNKVEGLPREYPECIVIRPDGYVAWSGDITDLNVMLTTLRDYFHLKSEQENVTNIL